MSLEFQAANDAAADKLVDFLANAPPDDSKPEPDVSVVAAPASGSDGTTPSNDDGATPDAPEVTVEGEPEVEPEPVTVQSSVDDFDPQKTLSKYKTTEEKEKALVEKDRELLKRGEENKRLSAELESLKGAKPAAKDDEEPTDFDAAHRLWLQRIHESKPEDLRDENELRISRSLAVLSDENKQLGQMQTKVKEIKTKESGLLTDAARLATIIESQAEDLKADPDDFALSERLKANREKAKDLRFEIVNVRTDGQQAELELRDAQASMRDKLVNVDDYAKRAHLGQRQQKHATATEAQDTKRLNDEWLNASKKLFSETLKKDNFTPLEQKVALQGLANKLNEHVRVHGVPENFLEWQSKQTGVFDEVRKLRTDSQQALLTRKASDLPRKPADNEIKKPAADGSKPSSYNKTMEAAARRFSRELGL